MIGAEAAARLARRFAKCSPEVSERTRALIARLGSAARAEARAAAARLDAIGELFAVRLAEFGEQADWSSDTTDVVASEVAAELRVSQAKAHSELRYARAMRERLPRVAEVFRAGDIDLKMFQAVVFGTELITDELVLGFVDAELCYEVGSWTALTRGRLRLKVDEVVARVDRDAVRARREATADRGVWISDRPDGLSDVTATVFTSTARAVEAKLAALIATVCIAAAELPGWRAARGGSGADSRRRRCGYRRWERGQPGHRRRQRGADSAGVGRRAGRPLPPAVARPSWRCTAGAGVRAVPGVGRVRACQGPHLSRPGVRQARDALRRGPHDPVRRRWRDARLEPEMSLSRTSFAEDVLGLAGRTTARRDGDLDVSGRGEVRHHRGQCVTVSVVVPAHCSAARAGAEPTGRGRTDRDDAPTPPDPRPGPGRGDYRRTSRQPTGPLPLPAKGPTAQR